MKAMICDQLGPADSLNLKEVASPVCGERQVKIQIHACGVNFPDILIIQGKYQFKPELPFSPGGEVSGVIIEKGSKVSHLKEGMRVLALCGWGGFAEEVVVDASRVFPIPDALDDITAASTLYTYGTVYHALVDRAQLQKGAKVLVLGASGGVGLAAVELANVLGAEVIAAASSEDKLETCKHKGAQHLIDYSKPDWKDKIKELVGEVDVIVDPVGGDYSILAHRCMAWGGKHLVIGFAAGSIPEIPLNLTLLKGSAVMGVFWGSFAEKEPQKNLHNFSAIMKLMAIGQLRQHYHAVYPLECAKEALKAIEERTIKGKAVVLVKEVERPSSPAKKEKAKAQPTKGKFHLSKMEDLDLLTEHDFDLQPTLVLSQDKINQFAEATGDFQWIHVDPKRAKDMLPGGKTLAHGYLSLSASAGFISELMVWDEGVILLNYGTNKVRFPEPVPVDSQIQLKINDVKVDKRSERTALLTFNCEIRGEKVDKPYCAAELLVMVQFPH
ncbi:MAG: zinc-binding dehydrogenase [Cyclobacteriaceae bacterium]|nr:zinc-binding dehydrogenase [Cyclobacteriaceae bacterium]MCH8515546.1 zinc-binding dehydrogenase [Cyclobacteriaceae bacterium]